MYADHFSKKLMKGEEKFVRSWTGRGQNEVAGVGGSQVKAEEWRVLKIKEKRAKIENEVPKESGGQGTRTQYMG